MAQYVPVLSLICSDESHLMLGGVTAERYLTELLKMPNGAKNMFDVVLDDEDVMLKDCIKMTRMLASALKRVRKSGFTDECIMGVGFVPFDLSNVTPEQFNRGFSWATGPEDMVPEESEAVKLSVELHNRWRMH